MQARTIPGPSGIPVLGSAVAYLRDPLGFLSATAEAFGPVAEFRLGPRRMVLLSQAEQIEDVLVRKAEAFSKSALLRNAGRAVLGSAIDTLDGEAWSERVRQVAPALRRDHVERGVEAAARLAEVWARGLEPGELRRLDHDLLSLCLRVEQRTLLGFEQADPEALALGAAFGRALDGWNAKLVAPTPDWLPTPANLRMRRAMRKVHRFVRDAIASRRDSGRGEIPLDVLLRAGLSEGVLRDELAVLVVLGAHQLSLALAWTIHEIARHPAVDERIAAGPDPAYLHHVVDEALRLHPPFFLLVRDPVREVAIGGHRIAPGMTVALSPWVTQRSERYWKAPLEFRPERWEGGEAKATPQYACFPFGGGRRACMAKALVRGQLVAMLAAILSRLRFASVSDAPVEPDPAIALRMRGGLWLAVHARGARARRASWSGRA